jgi:hypothetical protein
MRARLDLYGDGDAQGTHMSIFLVILKGEYDAILTWPFDFPVIFCLFDQSGQGCHIIDAFYPDTRSPSFQRPCSKEKIASGILKYCPLAVMKQQGNYYIRNDRMYIKIMVDFLGIRRPILPYTLGLNPGLPTHEQEIQCRIEIEKYKRLRAALVAEIDRSNQEVAQRSLIRSYPSIPVGNRQQPPASTTNSESMQCEDVSDEE